MKNFNFKTSRKSRRGVGGIIAGVILMAIIFTSVLVFFITINSNDKARLGYEFRAQQENRDKVAEKYAVFTNPILSGQNLNVWVENTGSISMRGSQMLLYCTDCSNPLVPVVQPLDFTLNMGSISPEFSIGPITTGNTYKVDVISERGNIISSRACLATVNECETTDDEGELTDEEVEQIVTEGIIQGTGVVQLDYKAFGAIFPDLSPRAGVDQRGWEVVVSSPYGNATGYPGFEIPYELDVIYVEKFRNLDDSGDDLILHRDTSLLTNIGKEQSNQPDIEFICKEDIANRLMISYDEKTNNKALPATPTNAGRTAGWHEVYFCSTEPAEANNDYRPTNDFNSFHPLFMVIRGHFDNSLAEYAQTVPYQSSSVGSLAASNFNACLRGDSHDINTNCASPTTTDNSSTLLYSAPQAQMIAGLNAWVHVNTVTTDISVSWIYPDGTRTVLAEEQSLNTRKNLSVTLPTTNSDGASSISCSAGTGTSEFYTLKVTDEYDSQGRRNVYYMTFEMIC